MFRGSHDTLIFATVIALISIVTDHVFENVPTDELYDSVGEDAILRGMKQF